MSYVPRKFIRCHFCDETITQKNFARHVARKHQGTDEKQRTHDLVCSASLCMLRKTEVVNVPEMAKYLEAYLSEILADYRQPLRACTFAVAQKVSAVYVDTLVGMQIEVLGPSTALGAGFTA